ncbi:MAG: BamA/TamA family outer membrane protein [Candidatus Marinimicrobia bacterium]|nr:BamA/TamA family outer membrane protein [Candidatus Neomarinimicrobiota bacterium]MBT3617711.1 BamA/TamA family outer membrane protein [Candidatus Neomarinimicrobiota bacterium]MBT3828414.1 BamA/TamA family outer membrane protein [Candidatus Neomarinimicrobiota bacterium]MBT3997532.1 BamA/TamA family outer membrane protein [Candidatus Neomarinimicrobiota bacterium]MBT4280693.1 BamA/TamA family outer membrane protein [Candidatus Neomarinimicrobiota bacterium]
MKHFTNIIFCLFVTVHLGAQGPWQLTGRSHSELDWFTLETDHYNVHYHNGIEDIAERGASIAEQVWPLLLEQLDMDTIPRIDIIFTTQDEIMNGYALWTYQTFIWVDQNDAALWLEDDKWLFQVLSHELQHIVLLHGARSWVPEPFGSFIISGMPGWFVEGTAEYYTERWRPWRADISHKYHVMTNKMDSMDPHHDGFSKMKYWSDRFGDSTIAKTLHYRNDWKIFDFEEGFKKATSVDLDQFEEDWRRHMNTYYYGYRSQKESLDEVGTITSLPIMKAVRYVLSPDSLRIAITGYDNEDQLDMSLYIATRDTSKPDTSSFELFFTNLFGDDEDTTETASNPKPIYDLEEIDYGAMHSAISWSPDSKELTYAKYHFSDYQSIVWDIRVVEIETGKGRWITESMRASHPAWSPDGEKIALVAHQNNISNLYTINTDGTGQKKLTDFNNDTQIMSLAWSPDGNSIAMAKAGPDGNMDIYTHSIATGEMSRVTDNPSVDYLPIWHPDGKQITFTSHRGSTPNLHTVDLTSGNQIQNTDVADALWGVQWVPGGDKIFARTIGDVDSNRVIEVDPSRESTTTPLTMRDEFTRWRTTMPPIVLDEVDVSIPPSINRNEPYKFYKNIKHFMSFALPFPDGSSFGITSFTDGTGRHLFQGTVVYDWSGGTKPAYGLAYINAEHGPVWSLVYNHNFRWDIREYDKSKSGLRETLDGVIFNMTVPYNFGDNLSSSHFFGVSLEMHNRQAAIGDSLNPETGEILQTSTFGFTDLPMPESGKEGIVSLQYAWLNRRPNASNIFLPKQGFGLLTRLDIANKAFLSDFDYQRVTLDAFVNVPLGPTALFLRTKGMAMFGDPPAQDTLALTKDNSLYFPGGRTSLMGGAVSFPETHNIRGWDGVRMGNKLIFGTAEFRFPFISELPINVLGFTLGSMTGALFTDFGNVWVDEQTDLITTAGYELKVALKLGSAPIFIFGIGEAQRISEWQDGNNPNYYARLSLINPF